MSFSITGNLLAGSTHRPNTYTIAEVRVRQKDKFEVDIHPFATQNWLDRLGRIPLVSTLSGLSRFLLGTLHAIVHLSCAIFNTTHRNHHLQESYIGLIHIERGLVEAIPFIGNVLINNIDYERSMYGAATAEQTLAQNLNHYSGQFILFSHGKEMDRRNIEKDSLGHNETLGTLAQNLVKEDDLSFENIKKAFNSVHK